jgi:branched-chain amino acid transport system ATP-binding protein
LLRIDNISTYYGKFEAIKEISLYVEKGELVTLIGANGAGKTTIMRTICGLNKPKKGKILFENQDITFADPVARVKMGIIYCPEGRKLFPDMTVMENLEMGAYTCESAFNKNLREVFELFPILDERKDQKVGSLSGGEQQMLAIGRSLMSEPKLALFDEPSTGLAPILVTELMNSIKFLSEQGRTILLVEQNVAFAFEVSHRGYIIETGKIVLEGGILELRENRQVKEAYLGG